MTERKDFIFSGEGNAPNPANPQNKLIKAPNKVGLIKTLCSNKSPALGQLFPMEKAGRFVLQSTVNLLKIFKSEIV